MAAIDTIGSDRLLIIMSSFNQSEKATHHYWSINSNCFNFVIKHDVSSIIVVEGWVAFDPASGSIGKSDRHVKVIG